MRSCLIPLFLSLVLIACDDDPDPRDAGRADAGGSDAGGSDAGGSDAGPPNPIEVTGSFVAPESGLWDPGRDVWYVTSLGQAPMTEDEPAYITVLDADGVVTDARLIEIDGDLLGMALLDGTLYVSHGTELLEVDPDTGTTTPISVAGAGFLNDVAAGAGVIYVSDTATNRVLQYTPGGAVEVFSDDSALAAPNGVAVSDGTVYVVTLGAFPPNPTTPGGVFSLDSAGVATRIGDVSGVFDGVEPDGDGLLVSDFFGELYRVAADGTATVLWDASAAGLSALADIGFDPVRRIVIAPDLLGNAVHLYSL